MGKLGGRKKYFAQKRIFWLVRLKNAFLSKIFFSSPELPHHLGDPSRCPESPKAALQGLYVDLRPQKIVVWASFGLFGPTGTGQRQNGKRKAHRGRGRAEGTQRDLLGRRDPRGCACRLVVHRTVVGVRA